MKLINILQDKGGNVVTLDASATLLEAAEVLDDKKIGAAVAVDSSGRLVGVLSERDIVRRVARHGKDALEMSVSEAMTREVITATPDLSIQQGLEQMTDRRIRHLPVVSEGELIGIVSIGDLVKRRISAAEAEAEAMKQYIHAG
ncbi:MAG: inosine-5-monophosphate dehydrogenase [Ponticaulis sp.]|nr:inosine-5-monophosphate dehydrogenase [Ponticaulis sp.]|tara:strand:- start:460 stop:891 length:432 start_codon:yes stop_codon:yes gene_type:complete